MSSRGDRLAAWDFALDPFQLRAIDAIDDGRSVLVAAPTGSGKTVVAEYAVAKALAEGGKAFYTAPIKALSNQKFGDLARIHGTDRVGLLTGDNAVNGEAPVVVMTTEVLRNMIYASSPALQGLRYVVLDEVHYLQDAYRGPVWEEVILHLPPAVKLVCLSATVSNAEELAEWITTVRGPTDAVIETTRPVELVNLYCVGDKASPELHLLPTLVDGYPNQEASRLDAESLRGPSRRPTPDGRARRRYFTPRRVEVVDRLSDEDLLPAIYFIFSRAACDDAVTACLSWGLRLTEAEEAARIRAIAERRCESLAATDKVVLGYDAWVDALALGVAAHHAGMVPPFKETVEECFTAGLVKVVFATETLALGINMPARSVVIEKLSKFNGEHHEFLTPGTYTQLTGRAGRRGLDPVGYAVVLWSPFVPFDQVAALASSRSFRLISAFRPTYNMAANLVRRYEPAEAHHLLNLSFAQYQADTGVVKLETRLESRLEALARAEAEATCERGSVVELAGLRQDERSARRRSEPRDEIEEALAHLQPGHVIEFWAPKSGGKAAVLSLANRGEDVRVRLITPARKVLTLAAADFDQVPVVLATIDVPQPYLPTERSFQHQMARRLQHAKLRYPDRPRDRESRRAMGKRAADVVAAHPVNACPDVERHLRALGHARRLEAEVAELRRSVKGRSESLARRFDRVLRLMEAWGFLDGWALTQKGHTLLRVYHECDLLIAEALDVGLFDGLDPASLAGLASCLTYEHRSPAPPPAPWFPSSRVRARWADLERLADELNGDEHDAGLPLTRRPDAGFFALAHAWAAGEDLDEVLADEDLSGGDFVRNVKQLIDLLRQIGDVATDRDTATSARRAADGLFRGVVSASTVLGDTVVVEAEAADDATAATVEGEVPDRVERR